jgi:hypothetical protein
MFGMLNQNIHRTFWLKHPLYPSFAQINKLNTSSNMAESSCDEWEAISEMLIKEGDEAAGFLVLHDKPTEELNEELKGKMTDLQETIKRLSEPGLSGHTDEPNIDMETKEGEPSDLCVRRSSRLFSRRLQQAGGLPGVLPEHPRLLVNMLQSCTEAELAEHPPLSEAVARQDSATKRQSGPWDPCVDASRLDQALHH